MQRVKAGAGAPGKAARREAAERVGCAQAQQLMTAVAARQEMWWPLQPHGRGCNWLLSGEPRPPSAQLACSMKGLAVVTACSVVFTTGATAEGSTAGTPEAVSASLACCSPVCRQRGWGVCVWLRGTVGAAGMQ